jgi:hypothetical protein
MNTITIIACLMYLAIVATALVLIKIEGNKGR